jgi:hypothetical protein
MDICPVFNPAMSFEIDGLSSDDGSGTKNVGDTIGMRERVQPKIAVVDHFDNHARWKTDEWHRIINGAGSLFNGTDMSFNLWNVVVMSGCVESHLNVCQIAPNGLELSIHRDLCHDKTALGVDALDLLHRLDERL